jgi:hypothetical protein
MKISEKVYMDITYTFAEKKSPLASTIASIRERNALQGWMTTSLSIVVITSETLALREVRVL